MKTRVKFRKFPQGDIIAIFPNWEESPGFFLSYQHFGQHGGCAKGLRLKRATPEEYSTLLEELIKIGYDNLEIVK